MQTVILAVILVIVHRTKHTVNLVKEFDKNNIFLKFGRNLMINDLRSITFPQRVNSIIHDHSYKLGPAVSYLFFVNIKCNK